MLLTWQPADPSAASLRLAIFGTRLGPISVSLAYLFRVRMCAYGFCVSPEAAKCVDYLCLKRHAMEDRERTHIT